MKEYKFKIAGQDYTTSVEDLKGGNFKVTVNGQTYDIEVPQKKAAAPKVALPAAAAPQAGGPVNVNSEIPGTVTKVNVANGQHVKRGETLLVIEAMKMANDIVSEVDGTVQRVAVSEGQNVMTGELLVEMVADFVAAKAEIAPKPAPVASAPVSAPAAPAPAAPKPVAGNTLTAPLPGTVKSICVKVGDTVKTGDAVLMLEAMKMENSITAEASGTVKAILVSAGEQVQTGQALVEFA